MDSVGNPASIYFKGSKVFLVPFEKEDIAIIREWINDEEISFFQGARFPVSYEEQVKWYEKTQQDKTWKSQ